MIVGWAGNTVTVASGSWTNITFTPTWPRYWPPGDGQAGVREPRRPAPDPIQPGDFYEDDEPLEEILAAWAGGTKAVTREAPPR